MANQTNLNEKILDDSQILERDPSKLPKGILARVRRTVCKIGEKNANNRKYEKQVWEKVFGDSGFQKKLENRQILGEMEHPETSALKLDKDRTSHVVSNMFIDEATNTIKADFDLLPTEAGKFIFVLHEAGVKVGASTRADGELEEAIDEDGSKYYRVVPESYKFTTIDHTGDPSCQETEPELIVKAVRMSYEDKSISKNVAIALLEKAGSDDAKKLEEQIKIDKQHKDCKCKLGEKKCSNGSCGHVEEVKGVEGAEEIEEVVTETIKKIGPNKWRLYSKDGKKNLGTFDSLEAAKKHEGEVQYFKHHESVEEAGAYDVMKGQAGDRLIIKWRYEGSSMTGASHFASVEEFLKQVGSGNRKLNWYQVEGQPKVVVNETRGKKETEETEEKKPYDPDDPGHERDQKDSADEKKQVKEELTTSSDKSGQPANLAAAKEDMEKSDARNQATQKTRVETLESKEEKDSMVECGKCGFQYLKSKGKCPECSSTESSPFPKKSNESNESKVEEGGEGPGDLASLSDAELLGRYKELAKDTHQEVIKDVENMMTEIQKRGLEVKESKSEVKSEVKTEVKEDVQVMIAVPPQVKTFLLDNWKLFLSEQDAVENLIKVFHITPEKAKEYVEGMEKGKGRISAVYAMSNERIQSLETQLNQVSERLAISTAERDRLVENYAKDSINFTMKIDELKTTNALNLGLYDSARIEAEIRQKDIISLKEQLDLKTTEVNKLNENLKLISKDKELFEKQVREKDNEITETKRVHQEELLQINEAHLKEKIKLYVSTKTQGMGLKLHQRDLTLLESAKSIVEVDALIKETQEKIREDLVQSTDGLSEIVIEKPVGSVQADLHTKVGTALKHFGAI